MRIENFLVSGIGVIALAVAAAISWRWRALPTIPVTRTEFETSGIAAARGLRRFASVMAAGLIAGFLVVGWGGRLMMRLIAATSSDGAQGRLTEAEERVGEITLDGTLGFVLFVGLILPALAAFVYLALRHFLPTRAWSAGLVFGVLAVGTFGVGDPLSPDNIDFQIVTPVILAVGVIVAIGLLFGTTFAALASHFESSSRLLFVGKNVEATGKRTPYYFLVLLLPLWPLLVAGALYVGGCAIAKGRVATLFDHPRVQSIALGLGLLVTAVALWRLGVTAADIV